MARVNTEVECYTDVDISADEWYAAASGREIEEMRELLRESAYSNMDERIRFALIKLLEKESLKGVPAYLQNKFLLDLNY